MTVLVIVLASIAATVALSYALDALRSEPPAPDSLAWAPSIPLRFVDVDGVRLRYIVTGDGPAVVLLHTLRTQLDMFQKIIPTLATRFRVYALDYPGHGFSDIPAADYSADYFVRTVGRALERLDVRDAVIVGESIGGSIGLLLAARQHPRVRAVAVINPYDYDRGRGLRRSSWLANVIFGVSNVPVMGPTVERLRSFPVVARVFQGGLHRRGTMPRALAREMYRVADRRGHARAFASLVRRWPTWEAARAEYASIDRPVLLIYGDHDWSHEAERQADARAIRGAELRVVPEAGHFLALDAPEELLETLLAWPPLTGGGHSSAAATAGGGMIPRSI